MAFELKWTAGDNFFIQMLKPSFLLTDPCNDRYHTLYVEKERQEKDIGEILLGFAVLMYGMESMSGAVEPLADVRNLRIS